MASVEKLSEKLSKILQKNIDEKKGCAIAITGEWGIGKTHFWNYFYENNHKDFNGLHYAYVSLFGVDSLESLKWEIAVKSFSITNKEDKFSGLKSIFAKGFDIVDFSKLNNDSNGFGLALTSNLVKNSISHFISHTVICIDDLERKSDKLDLKDVMGLVSQLKLEKNCQVIVILHDDKAGDEFQEYKEKVFDGVFYLTENFEIIKEIIENYEVIYIYQEFYDKLQVKNLRFYERVNKDYNEIVSLADDLTITSKEHILRNLLIVRYADYFPIKIQCEDESYNFLFDLEFLSKFDYDYSIRGKEKSMVTSALDKFFGRFISFYELDDWIKIIANNIINHHIDDDLFLELVEQDKISEQKTKIKEQLDKLMIEWQNLDIKDNFANRFYDVLIEFIGIHKSIDLDSASFYYEMINSQNADLANDFKKIVQNTIELMIKTYNRKPLLDYFYHPKTREDNIFYDFAKDKIDNYYIIRDNNVINDDDFCNYFVAKFYDKPILKDVDLRLLNKGILSKVIWSELEEIRYFGRKKFIQMVLSYCFDENREQVRQWIVELLQEKSEKNPDSELAIKFWLTHTENLTKF